MFWLEAVLSKSIKNVTLKNKTETLRGFNIIKLDRVRPKTSFPGKLRRRLHEKPDYQPAALLKGYAKQYTSGFKGSSLIHRTNNKDHIQNSLRQLAHNKNALHYTLVLGFS